jgi:hypothetical protein
MKDNRTKTNGSAKMKWEGMKRKAIEWNGTTEMR